MSRTPLSTVPIKAEPIPPAIVEEIETFEAEAMRMVSGDVSGDLFRPFRLQYGIYGQRQAGVQMVRIKIPFGGLTANQLRRAPWPPPCAPAACALRPCTWDTDR